MADVLQTAANVHPAGSNARVLLVQVGEAVSQGDVAYLNSSDSKYYRADANDTEAKAEAKGIFVTAAATDGYAVIQTSGPIDVGGALTVGVTYLLSTNLGKIRPTADLGSGEYVTRLGVASATDTLNLSIDATGIQTP